MAQQEHRRSRAAKALLVLAARAGLRRPDLDNLDRALGSVQLRRDAAHPHRDSPVRAARLTNFRVADRDHGQCNLPSNVDPGVAEAHRCFGADRHMFQGHRVTYIHDPCMDILLPPDRGKDRLACVANPWTRRVALFTVKTWTEPTRRPPYVRYVERPVYRRSSIGRSPAWALELENGQRCVFVSGATGVIADMRWNYFCGKGDGSRPTRREAAGSSAFPIGGGQSGRHDSSRTATFRSYRSECAWPGTERWRAGAEVDTSAA